MESTEGSRFCQSAFVSQRRLSRGSCSSFALGIAHTTNLSPRPRAHALIVALALGVGFLFGCERKATKAERTVASPPWTDQLERCRGEVLTGSWDHAESAWAKLNKEHYTEEEMRRWIRFQTEILEQTKNDALKISLRHSAMQQLYWNMDATRPYLGWLKDGLRTNLFGDPITVQKAQETVDRLEGASK